MKKQIIFLTFAFTCFFCLAQNAANWWYFGQNAGLDFSSGSPVAIFNGQLNTGEGCATISDNTGNLLFYTDGITVYTRQHTAMPNGMGLVGCSSSTMSAIVVPSPSNATQYYIFTTDCVENNMASGFRYSVVDMTLAGGLGDVIPATKNTLIKSDVCEKITAVMNANQTGYWIITHENDGNGFYAYQLTSAGLNMTPVVSNIGVSLIGNAVGYLRTSHQGNRLAVAHYDVFNNVWGGVTEIFDFDNITGNISNPISFINNETPKSYGLEFSPNDRYLYVSNFDAGIYQIDLQAGSNLSVINSLTTIGTLYGIGALQLGPDGKIYCANYSLASLSVINNPNLGGASCSFTPSALPLGARISKLGLPNFVQNLTITITSVPPNVSICSGETLYLIGANGQANYSYSWTNTNGFSSTAYQDILFNAQVSDAGQYIFTVYDNGGNVFFQDTMNVTVYPTYSDTIFATMTTGQNYVLPDGSSVLSAGIYPITLQTVYGCDSIITTVLSISTNINANICKGESYILPNGTSVSVSGVYPVVFTTANACDSTIITNLSVYPTYHRNIYPEICVGETYTLPDGNLADSTGEYIAYLQTIHSCDSIIHVHLTVHLLPVVDLGQDTAFCQGENVTFYGPTGYKKYLWSPIGATTHNYSPTLPGQYVLSVRDAEGCWGKDSVEVTAIYPLPSDFLPKDTAICDDSPIVLYVPHYQSYLWNNGSQNAAITVKDIGFYSLTVIDENGCRGTEEIHITRDCPFEIFFPNAFSPNSDGKNDFYEVFGQNVYTFNMTIFDRWGRVATVLTSINEYWDGTIKGVPAPEGVYTFRAKANNINNEGIDRAGTITLIR